MTDFRDMTHADFERFASLEEHNMDRHYKVVDTFNGGVLHEGPLSYEEAETVLDACRAAFFKPLGNRNSRFMGGIVPITDSWHFDHRMQQFVWSTWTT